MATDGEQSKVTDMELIIDIFKVCKQQQEAIRKIHDTLKNMFKGLSRQEPLEVGSIEYTIREIDWFIDAINKKLGPIEQELEELQKHKNEDENEK